MGKITDCILITDLANSDDHGLMKDDYYETHDRVFLPCVADIKGDNALQQLTFASDFAIMNGARMYQSPIEEITDRCAVLEVMLRDLEMGISDLLFNKTLCICEGGVLKNRLLDEDDFSEFLSYDQCIGIRPEMVLDCEKVIEIMKRYDSLIGFKIIDTGYSQTPCLEFGEYPQTVVTNESLIEMLDNSYNCQMGIIGSPLPKATGKYYSGSAYIDKRTKKVKLEKCPEYEFQDERYVRVSAQGVDQDSILSDHTLLDDGKPTIKWCKVEPIQWKIINWWELPQKLNPLGSGSAKEIRIRTNEVLISGIPFQLSMSATNLNYWQNSIVRAYLNGYNLEKEINNGNGSYIIASNELIDCEGHGFLEDAIDDYEKRNSLMRDIVDYSRRKSKFGITIPERNLSIDDQIRYYIDNRRSFMLHGKSGIGKSRRIADIDPNYYLLTLRNGMMPEEIIGKECPNPTGEGTKWYPPSWYNDLCTTCSEDPEHNHILFIDELTNVNEYEQSLVYHIVLNHCLGVSHGRLPENCVVVAAGNSKEESNSAYNMSEPLFRRFHGHIYLPLDIESLLEWGSEPRKNNPEQYNLHPLVSRFLSTYGNSVLYTDYDVENNKYAIDPRAWEQVSDIIYDNNGELWIELISNKIGEDTAVSLLKFAEKNFITIEDILTENYAGSDIPIKLDEQYALALSLRIANEREIYKVREFISKYLSGETLAKFDYIWINNNPERAMIIEELRKEQKGIKLSLNSQIIEEKQ